MPVLNMGDSNMSVMPLAYSPSTVQRRFEILDELTIGGEIYWIAYDSKTPFAAIINASPSDVNGELRHMSVAMLELARPASFDGVLSVKNFWADTDAIQVEGVVVDGAVQDVGLATRLYETLVVKKNLTLMSDNNHYAGGKALWKRIAAKSKKLIVFVFDSDEGKFYPYDGERVQYDGVVIPDDKIWSVHPDTSRFGVILVAEDAKRYPQMIAA